MKRIYNADGTVEEASNINGYLLDAPNVFIENRGKPLLNNMPKMSKGSQPTDDGNLLLTVAEKDELIKKYPRSKKFIREFIGAEEFIKGKKRYCLWLDGVSPNEYRKISLIRERLKNVAEFRRQSPTASVQQDAETPMIFTQIRQPESGNYLLIPRVSSERRRYIPIGYVSSDVIASDAVYVISNSSLYIFAMMTSSVHNAWMRVVCGRLKSDYRYTPAVYNNFPWISPTSAQAAKIEQTAQAILDTRAKYPNASLADLYDEFTMPADLRKAHRANDRAVMAAYGFNEKMSEADIVAALFALYEGLTK